MGEEWCVPRWIWPLGDTSQRNREAGSLPQGLWVRLTRHFRCDNWAGQKPTATWRGDSHSQEVPKAAGRRRPQLHTQQQPQLESSPPGHPQACLCSGPESQPQTDQANPICSLRSPPGSVCAGRAGVGLWPHHTPGQNQNVPGTPWAQPHLLVLPPCPSQPPKLPLYP